MNLGTLHLIQRDQVVTAFLREVMLGLGRKDRPSSDTGVQIDGAGLQCLSGASVLSCPRVLNIHCLLVYTAKEIKWLPIIEPLPDTLSSRFSILY